MAQNIRYAPSTKMRIIHFLAKHDMATREQVISYCGGRNEEATAAINYLVAKGFVSKGVGVNV